MYYSYDNTVQHVHSENDNNVLDFRISQWLKTKTNSTSSHPTPTCFTLRLVEHIFLKLEFDFNPELKSNK